MDTSIKIDVASVAATVSRQQIDALLPEAVQAMKTVETGSGAGNDFLGWTDLPTRLSAELVNEINATAESLRKECEVVVSIGIGGSYLGAKAVIEALGDSFGAYRHDCKGPQMLFAGQNIGEDYLYELMDYLRDKRFGIIVISKSGTTTEPAIAFRLLKELLERKEGKEHAARHIVAS